MILPPLVFPGREQTCTVRTLSCNRSFDRLVSAEGQNLECFKWTANKVLEVLEMLVNPLHSQAMSPKLSLCEMYNLYASCAMNGLQTLTYFLYKNIWNTNEQWCITQIYVFHHCGKMKTGLELPVWQHVSIVPCTHARSSELVSCWPNWCIIISFC